MKSFLQKFFKNCPPLFIFGMAWIWLFTISNFVTIYAVHQEKLKTHELTVKVQRIEKFLSMLASYNIQQKE